MANLSRSLNHDKALIFRITHRDNLPWLLANGLYCRSTAEQDAHFTIIGKQELIDKRVTRPVPPPSGGMLSDYIPFYFTPSGGMLSDYIPFYFTPSSMMLYNIVTGRGVAKQRREDIVVLVSSLPHLQQLGVPFLFTDRHAYLANAEFSSRLDDLAGFVPWDLLQSKDFKRDPEHPEKTDRYQAEALVHQHLPVSALLGMGTYTDEVRAAVETQAATHHLDLKVVTRPNWFFP
ncbi:type II toxin-antitoxin system toxin DNA ADP-ribosyl transferase DarT [Salinicola halophyticus]|uniref:type II toxin-antitoxin system toxin DNA ADP-ribosyl transferase DarT n=1 Tax=Salinicola halophyticus TaxID=1808881 RepID=UPI003F484064